MDSNTCILPVTIRSGANSSRYPWYFLSCGVETTLKSVTDRIERIRSPEGQQYADVSFGHQKVQWGEGLDARVSDIWCWWRIRHVGKL